MAIMNVTLYSEVLHCQNEAVVYLPGDGDGRGYENPYRVLWTIHGGNGDCNEWLGHSSLFRLAEKHDYAVILLSVCNSFGMDMVHGGQYATYLETELVPYMRRLLPCLSSKREDNVAVGVSMGGFAATRWAMNCPEMFGKCAAFAGALAMPIIYRRFCEGHQPGGPDFHYAFGSEERLTGNCNDILHMAEKNIREGKMMPIWMICGVDDFGYDLNRRMMQEMIKLGSDVTFLPVEGVHSFDAWDGHLPEFFSWLENGENWASAVDKW